MLRILRGNIKSNVAAKYSDEIFYNYASKISLTELNQIINNLIIEEIIDFDFGYGHELFYFISENAKYEEIIEDTRISLEDLIIEEILKRGKS